MVTVVKGPNCARLLLDRKQPLVYLGQEYKRKFGLV